MSDELSTAVTSSLWTHLFTVVGFLLAVFAIARLMSEKRQPVNTMAWLLVIVLIPYLGVPLFLILGGRKLQKLAARKGRILPHLPGALPATKAIADSPTVHTMVAAGACEAVGGNRVRLLTTGEDAYAELEAQIRAARHSIHITTFILGRDDSGRRLIALLAERAREGVKVRLLLDALGCLFSSRGFVDPLREAGGEVARFMPVVPLSTRGSANLRNHRKIAVFDQHTAIVGGHNLAREYIGPTPWRKRWVDFGAVLSGPAAALLNEVFLADWVFASGQSLDDLHRELDPAAVRVEGRSELQVVASGPDVAGDPLYDGILSMIQEAKHSVWIITPYFIPDEVLLRSLLVKARAGKDVTLIVPARSNHPITDHARRHSLRQLRQAGGRVLLYGPAMMHAKAMIVDDRIGLVGSANFDLRSLFVNFEIGVVLYSEPDVRAMRIWAGELVRHCREHDPNRKRRFPILTNMAEDLSRLLAPLL
jgi:cardiolipin synthase